jgi:hypothetical protein
MATSIDDVKAALREASATTAQSATGAIGAAMVTAGLAAPPAGQKAPAKSLGDAGSLAATAAQAAAASRDFALALAQLEQTFPTPPATP